jgi:hypothetical protein
MAIPFLDELRSWHESYATDGGRRSVLVDLHEGPEDRPKRSASIDVHARAAEGQLILWESGECETSAVGTDVDGEHVVLLLRSRVLADPTLVAAVADDLVDHVADYSGT